MGVYDLSSFKLLAQKWWHIRISSYGLKSIQKVVVCLYDVHITIMSAGVSWQASHCYSSQGPQLGMTNDLFPLIVAFITLSSRDEASRSVSVRFHFCSVTQEHGFFGNRIILLSSTR